MVELRNEIIEKIYKLEKINAIIEENIRARGYETHYEKKHHKEWYKGQLEAYKLIADFLTIQALDKVK